MRPLAIDVSQFGTNEANAEHIRSALQRGLPELSPAVVINDGTLVIVGSGPSLPAFVEEIRQERAKGRPICAIKGAHDLLCEKGIPPDLFLSVEPRDRRENLKHKNDNTVYLLASRVNPAVFDHLKGCKVVLWHSWSTEKEQEAHKGKMAIGGGTTSGLRAINVGYVLGFRRFVLYGFDSCLAEDKLTKRFTGEKAANIFQIHLCAGCQKEISEKGGEHCPKYLGEQCEKRSFHVSHALAQQADDFQKIYKVMPEVTIDAKGDGLIATIIRQRRKMGLHV